MSVANDHVYENERCVFCGVNNNDNSIYGPFTCNPPEKYTTETQEGASS